MFSGEQVRICALDINSQFLVFNYRAALSTLGSAITSGYHSTHLPRYSLYVTFYVW